jgi:N-acetylglutamate synthase-like GNAT family acetyltransferase
VSAEQPVGRIRPSRPQDLAEVLLLISGAGLPVAGVEEHLQHFLVLEVEGAIAGTVGLEPYGRQALLRSLAVIPGARGQGLGRRLCQAVLDRARELGAEEVLLLTETAAGFFERLGVCALPRPEVTGPVRSSVEFTSCCPVSAVCMRLPIPPLRDRL